MLSVPHSPPPVPKLPVDEDQVRAERQYRRWKILREDFRDEAMTWLGVGLPADVVNAIGEPDISCNTLADAARQLSTPGLYGTRPRVGLPLGEDAVTPVDAAAELAGEDGLLDACGYWTQGRNRQYLTLGLADWLVRVDLDEGELVVRPVKPFHVMAWDDARRPGKAVRVWELRLRFWRDKKAWIWCYDALDISGDEPEFRIIKAHPEADGTYQDVSNVFLDRGDGTFGALVGEDYPYVSADGEAVIPYVWFTPQDTGELWHSHARRGATQGALNAVKFATLANHAAKVTACEPVILLNVKKPGTRVQPSKTTTENPQPGGLDSIAVTLGSLSFMQSSAQGVNSSVHRLGFSGNLEALAEHAASYELRQFVRWGLNPDDVTRKAANPTSGSALAISNKGKREMAAIVEPMFRRADLEVIRMAAIVLNSRPGEETRYPERGYTIVYHQIPATPEEQREQRDQETWELDNDLISPVDVYQRKHPGTTDDDAINAIVRSKVHKATVEKRSKEALAAAGLDAPPEPPPPPAVPVPPQPPAEPAGEESP